MKLERELPGLDAPPWPGPLGQRIYEHISQEAWEMWEERMKMILNEYRLLPFQKEAQELVAKHMEEFFFGETAALPPGYVPNSNGRSASTLGSQEAADGAVRRRPASATPPRHDRSRSSAIRAACRRCSSPRCGSASATTGCARSSSCS